MIRLEIISILVRVCDVEHARVCLSFFGHFYKLYRSRRFLIWLHSSYELFTWIEPVLKKLSEFINSNARIIFCIVDCLTLTATDMLEFYFTSLLSWLCESRLKLTWAYYICTPRLLYFWCSLRCSIHCMPHTVAVVLIFLQDSTCACYIRSLKLIIWRLYYHRDIFTRLVASHLLLRISTVLVSFLGYEVELLPFVRIEYSVIVGIYCLWILLCHR